MATQEWAPIIAALTAGENLDYGQSYWLMDQVMSGELGEARLASFLTAMAIKGATVDEIHGLADGMQDHAAHVELPSRALDIVGTGGDGYKTVNISTMSAIVLAAMGIPLVKHGNRASTSKSGSADVIEALGVNLDLDADALRRVFDEVGIAFLFANKMHPSMRFAAPVRRSLGFPTAFNVLGPLTNPARVQACAIGASREENARLMAGVYASRGLSALVFRGVNTGLDELTTTDANQVWLVSDGTVVETAFDARESLGMASASIEDLAGGEASENAVVARDVLSGGGADAVRDAVALNVGAGILAWEGLEKPVTRSDFEQRMRGAVVSALDLAEGHEALLVSHQLPVWSLRLFLEGRPLAHDPRRRQCALASLTSLTFEGRTLVGLAYWEPAGDLLRQARDMVPGTSAARAATGRPAHLERSAEVDSAEATQ